MHDLVLFCINQYMKSEVHSFTNYKDDWGKIHSKDIIGGITI